MMPYQVAITVPFITIKQYSILTGMAPGTIKDKIAQGQIIIKKKEKPREKPLVNMIAMQQIAMREAEMQLP